MTESRLCLRDFLLSRLRKQRWVTKYWRNGLHRQHLSHYSINGYHAGKGGVIPWQSPDPYGGRLGFYCKQHPEMSVIDASEQILSEMDRGI